MKIRARQTRSGRRRMMLPSRRPSPATVIALVALAVAVFGTVQGSWAAGPAGPKAVKPKPTVVVTVGRGGIGPGETKEVAAKCPAGYSVIGGSYVIEGSVLTHASAAAVASAENTYSVEFVDPPANPLAGFPPENAVLTVGANCAKNGTPIVVDGPFPHK
jgi:hypothetical protein